MADLGSPSTRGALHLADREEDVRAVSLAGVEASAAAAAQVSAQADAREVEDEGSPRSRWCQAWWEVEGSWVQGAREGGCASAGFHRAGRLLVALVPELERAQSRREGGKRPPRVSRGALVAVMRGRRGTAFPCAMEGAPQTQGLAPRWECWLFWYLFDSA